MLGDLLDGYLVEVEVEEQLVGWRQLVDELVEAVHQLVVLGLGKVLECLGVEGDEVGRPLAHAQLLACGVHGNAVDPGGGGAVATEVGVVEP